MVKKSLYTKQLGSRVARNASPAFAKGRYHVICGVSNKWSVVAHGRVRPVKNFLTQTEAISFAKKTAQKLTGTVIVHAKTGQIRDTYSYVK